MKKSFFYLMLIILTGCSQTTVYEKDVYNDGRVNRTNVLEIAEVDNDLVEFSKDIYLKNPDMATAEHAYVGDEYELIDSLDHPNAIDYPDTHFFRIYCDSLSGKVMNWTVHKNYERLRGQGGFKKFYTCEVDGEVDGAIAYFVEHKPPFYRVEKHYLTNEKFEEYRNYYSTFFSEDGGLSIDRSALYDPRNGQLYRSYSHPIHLRIENDSNTTKTYDINDIYLVVNGKSYDTKLIKVENRRKVPHEEIVLSPGEIFEEDIIVKVRLLRGFNEEHVLSSEFTIDGVVHKNFNLRDNYEIQKVEFDNTFQRTAFQ